MTAPTTPPEPPPPDPLVAVLGEIRDVLREIRDAMPKTAKLPPAAMPVISGSSEHRAAGPRPERSNS